MKNPPKRAWLWSHDAFKYLVPLKYLRTAKAGDSKFCTLVCHVILALGLQTVIEWEWSRSRDIFTFWKISDNVSEMVQDRDIVTEVRQIGNHVWPIEWHDCQ